MSHSLAIAAVTSTLRGLLDRELNAELPGTRVSTRPPDRAGDGRTGNQVNLFLYHMLPNAAWRNVAAGQGTSAAAVLPPLALNLYYLLSAYGQDDDDAEPMSHRLLAAAMRAFHDHPVLEAGVIRDTPARKDVRPQSERVGITLQPLTLEEMTKLWTMFQTPYRLSVTYEVSVVVVDRPRR
jgi:hypothetical protein